jgi:hypothetical protein
MRIFIALLAALISYAAFAVEMKKEAPTKAPRTPASQAVEKSVIDKALTFLNPALGWSVNAKQKVDFDDKIWSKEALSDGSEIYKMVATPAGVEEEKRVILRDGENVSSITSFALSKDEKKKTVHEESASVIFHKGSLYAVTQCRDENDKAGRNCLTVTRELCSYVAKPATEFPKVVGDQLKVLEVRALATILALRGADHQLENMAKHGNRLGLKNPLQTTKGKLTAKDAKFVEKVRGEARAICQASNLDSDSKAVAAQ